MEVYLYGFILFRSYDSLYHAVQYLELFPHRWSTCQVMTALGMTCPPKTSPGNYATGTNLESGIVYGGRSSVHSGFC